MRIGVYFAGIKDGQKSLLNHFIVETFSLVAAMNPSSSFLIITRNELSSKSDIPSNTQVIYLKEKGGVLKALRERLKLQRILKKIKVDLFVSVNKSPLQRTSIPHCLIVQDMQRIKAVDFKGMASVIVFNKRDQENLTRQYGVSAERIQLIYPGATDQFEPITLNEKQEIQARYSGGTEYFLYNSRFDKEDNLVDLLKSFSQFKRRQQSSFKLLIAGASKPGFAKKFADYKYRSDVKFTEPETANITAAAYAVVLPFNTTDDAMAALNSMRSAVPVIAPRNSIVDEFGNGAILRSETNSIKDIADKMMHIYTDEDSRSLLIMKGKEIAREYSQERTALDLWQAILKALP